MFADPLVVTTEGQVAVVTIERPELLDQLDAAAVHEARRAIATLGDGQFAKVRQSSCFVAPQPPSTRSWLASSNAWLFGARETNSSMS